MSKGQRDLRPARGVQTYVRGDGDVADVDCVAAARQRQSEIVEALGLPQSTLPELESCRCL